MQPGPEELAKLRKGLRKRKAPVVRDGMWASQPGIGGFVAKNEADGFRMEWVVGKSEKEQPRKSAMFHDLCTNPERELERLELGWLIAELCAFDARRVMDSIGGPNEAMQAAAPMWEAEKNWRHWAIVPAGHMNL